MRKLLIHMTVLTLAGIAPAWAGNAPSDVLDPAAIFETEKPMLNEHIVVESNVVRLGDLFTNAGTRAEAAVAYRSEERRVGKECRSRWSPYH